MRKNVSKLEITEGMLDFELKELPSSEFTFGNRGADIPNEVYMGEWKSFAKWCSHEVLVGYQKNPAYRPEKKTFALMFDIDGNNYWSHVPTQVYHLLTGKTIV